MKSIEAFNEFCVNFIYDCDLNALMINRLIKWLEKQTLNEFYEIIVNQKSVGNRRTHETKGPVLRVSQPESDSSDYEQYVNQRNHFN